MLVSLGRQVLLLDALTATLLRSFTAGGEVDLSHTRLLDCEPLSKERLGGSVTSLDSAAAPGHISHLAVAGMGLWVASTASPTVALYHTESFIHMQDIDIATNVGRVLAERDPGASKRSIYVTALSATKGLLWVGTNVGIALTIPLPRLGGVPIVSGKANISYHAHFGPVRMFLALQPAVQSAEPPGTGLSLEVCRPSLSNIQSVIQEEEPILAKTVLKKQVPS